MIYNIDTGVIIQQKVRKKKKTCFNTHFWYGRSKIARLNNESKISYTSSQYCLCEHKDFFNWTNSLTL